MKHSTFYFLFSKVCLLFLFFVFCFLISSPAQATVLYLEPTEGEYHQADTFIVDLRINVEEECINTVETNVSFPVDLLEAVDFSRGNSILTIFLEEPKIQKQAGLVSFIGGVPGGYCGALPGDPGKSNLLGKIIFKAKETESVKDAKVEFSDSQVLLNDGLGTKAELTTESAIFTLLPGISEAPQIEEWQTELAKDQTLPEPFEIEINQDLSAFEGKYFIIFNTTDKQSGIDYYEVKEGKGDWQRATSPYILKDQEIKGTIRVKAVDKAGNERIAEYTPLKPFIVYLIIAIFVLMAGAIIWWVRRKSKK